MGKKTARKPIMLAQLLCVESIVIQGRIDVPEVCFEANESYLFVIDYKKKDIFTENLTGEVHYFNVPDIKNGSIDGDQYTEEHFELIDIFDPYESPELVDDFTLHRLEKINKYKDHYSLY